jgi:subtilisin-like proprotein convertase family protein
MNFAVATLNAQTEFTSGGPITIPSIGNASPYPSTINVSGFTSAVTAVQVKLNNLAHTFPDDLDIFLVAPSGQVCAVISDAGGGGSTYPGVNLVFEDAAVTAVPDTGPLTAGTYQPADYQAVESLPPGGIGSIGTNLNALLAGGVNGDWNLFVTDDEGGDSGEIASWALVFVGDPPLPPEIAVEQPAGSNIADGGSRDFGQVFVGANTSLVFTITNTGGSPLTGLMISNDGPDAAMFTVVSSPTPPLGAGQSQVFEVRFTPASTGVKTAALHIASNDDDENPFDITLTGTGFVNLALQPTYDLNKNPGTLPDAPNVTAYGTNLGGFGETVRVGDINGDGIGDLIVGAPAAGPSAPLMPQPGQFYIWFGKGDLAGKKDVDGTLGSPPDVTISGTLSDNGGSLDALALGDVNGDGITDLVLGDDRTHGPAEGRVFAGEAYIIFGRNSPATFPALINLEIQGPGGADVTIYGPTNSYYLTGSALTTGDANGDGVADILLGASGTTRPGFSPFLNPGEACIVFGRQSPAVFPAVIDLATNADVVLHSGGEQHQLTQGGALTTGDVNGDGVVDILLGASGTLTPGGGAGLAFVVFGRQNPATFPATMFMDGVGNVGPDVTIHGASIVDKLTEDGALAAGDITGDGVADIIVGAPRGDGPGESRTNAGEAYIIFGRQTPAVFPSHINLDPGAGGAHADVTIYGASADDELTQKSFRFYGNPLAFADVNSDGVSDLILGSPSADGPAESRPTGGEVYVVFGRTNFPTTLDLALSGSNGASLTIYGEVGSALSVNTVAAGDLNGDGVADLLLGAPNAHGPTPADQSAGQAYVIFGRTNLPATLDVTVQGDTGANVTVYGPIFHVVGAGAGGQLTGRDGIAAGDVNGDGVADLVLGAFHAEVPEDSRAAGSGELHVIFGIPAPEIVVEHPPGTTVPDGGSVSFYPVLVEPGGASPFVRTLTVRNTGNGVLALSSVTIDGPGAALFTASPGWASFVNPGGTTAVVVTYAPTMPGTHTATLHIDNNDADEDPYDITLIGRSFADDDSDGIADEWELLHAGDLTTLSATGDVDGDGQSDAAEYGADTDPFDPADALKVTSLELAPDGLTLTLTWTSKPTRLYRITHTAGLEQPFTTVLDNIIPDGGPTTTRMLMLAPGQTGYFHVEVSGTLGL